MASLFFVLDNEWAKFARSSVFILATGAASRPGQQV
jgi:hypothetical protein